MKRLADCMFEDFRYIASDSYASSRRIRAIEDKLTKLYRASRLRSGSDRAVPVTIPMPLTVMTQCQVGGEKPLDDMLLGNWFKLFFGILKNANVENARDEGGSAYALRSSGDVTFESCVIMLGGGTKVEAYEDYTLASVIKGLSTSRAVSYTTDRSRVSFQGTATADGEEFGLRQRLYNTMGDGKYFYLSRKVLSVLNGQVVTINIDFVEPWVYNTALLMYGIHNNSNVEGLMDWTGTGFTARTTSDVNYAGVELDVDTSPISWSPTAYSLPTPLPCSIERFLLSSYTSDVLIINGYRIPTSDETIYSVGLRQSLYDTGGTPHDTYLALIHLSEPVTFKANAKNLLHVRIVAF